MTDLARVLDEQRPSPEIVAAVRARHAEIAALLTGRGWHPRIYQGGSFAKHTAIAAAFDLDVVVYFPQDWPTGPRDLYAAVEHRLRDAGHTVIRHGVALRLQYTPGWHVDVVPGRALDEPFEYANLWHSERAATRKTSLKRHIDLARAGDREVIRLLKIWRARHNVPVGAFVLELAAARAAAAGSLEDRFARVLQFLTTLESARLIDPENSANVITDDLEWPRKREVADQAARGLQTCHWDQIVW